MKTTSKEFQEVGSGASVRLDIDEHKLFRFVASLGRPRSDSGAKLCSSEVVLEMAPKITTALVSSSTCCINLLFF